MQQLPTVPDSGVISFQDGRESVSRLSVSRLPAIHLCFNGLHLP